MKQHLRPTPNVPPIETQHECIHDFFTRLRRYVVRTHFFFCQSRHLQYGSSKIRALLESFASLGADAERELELLGGDLVDPLAFPRRDDAALVELELLDGCRRPVQLHGVGGRVDEVVRGRRGRRGGLEADPPGGVDRGADVGLVALRDGVRVLAPARAGGAGGGGDREEGVPEGVSGDDGGGGVPVGPADLGGRPRRRRRRRRRGRGERRRDGRAAGHAERRQVRQAPEEREQGCGCCCRCCGRGASGSGSSTTPGWRGRTAPGSGSSRTARSAAATTSTGSASPAVACNPATKTQGSARQLLRPDSGPDLHIPLPPRVGVGADKRPARSRNRREFGSGTRNREVYKKRRDKARSPSGRWCRRPRRPTPPRGRAP
jgi:hypothetical protein